MNRAVFVLLATLLAGVAQAEDYLSPMEERLRLSLGFVHLSTATDLQVDSSTRVPGTPLSAENDFRLSKSDFEAKFQVMVRVGERNRLRLDYFSLDRNGLTTLDRDIQFRDVESLAGDTVDSHLSIDVLSITYGYSFIHNEKFEVAATLGVNITDTSVRARVDSATRHLNQSEDQAGPFPTIGLDATYVISKRFYVDGRAQYLKAQVNHYSGSLGFYEFNVLYRLRPNVSFALGYEFVRAQLESSQTSKAGYFDFTTQGPELFVRVAF